MGVQNYLTDYNALKTFPMDLGRLLSVYGITTQKALLSKFTIKEKILPIMSSKADPNLSIPTLYYTIDAVVKVATDIVVTAYIPDVDQDILLELFKIALSHFSSGTAPEVMRDLMTHIDYAQKVLDGHSLMKMRDFRFEAGNALIKIKKYLSENQEVAVGYALAMRKESSPVVMGNAVMSSLSDLDIGENDDLRRIIFTDPFNDLATSDLTMDLIDKIAATAGKAISAVQTNSGIIEGAEVFDKEIAESTADYLIEVRCATGNVRSMISLCEETNCDMECDLFKETTASEDCVADIPKGRLGWGDPSIVGGDTIAIKANTDDIFSMSQITGRNIQYVLGSIISSDDAGERKVLTEKLKNAIVETMKWESTHENFVDIPVAHFVDTNIMMMETLVKNTKYAATFEEMTASLLEGIKIAVEEDGCAVPGVFNPCPTLNGVTPFPVALRSSQVAFDKICKASTDEEMDEAMLEFAKNYIVEENVFYRDSVTEGGASVTIRNLGKVLANLMDDAQHTGKFDNIHPRLLKMVDNCKTTGDLQYLRKDLGGGISQLNKLKDKVVAVETGKTESMDDKSIKGIEKRISKGLTSKKIDNHIKWINDVYKPAIAKKSKELGSSTVSEGEEFDDLMESNAVTKGARDVSRKVQKGSEKAIRNVGGTAHELKQAAHNAVDPMEKYIGQMMEKLKKEDANKRREIIVKGGVVPKVLRWVKRSIPLIAGAAIGVHVIPAAAVASGIALVGMIASDKYLDAKERRKILREIEDELEIVNEKIDDARGDSNKQKRYELIRIRNNLKRTQDRIRYNLKE